MQKIVPMTEGSIGKRISYFAVPLMLGNLFQQLYNTIDSLIVGNYLGYQALAAVSSSSSLIFMIIGFMMGLSAGAGVIVARYYGAKDDINLSKSVHTTVAFGIIVSIIMTILGVTLTPYILIWMGTPEAVMKDAVLYLQIFFAGSLGIGMYNIFVGIMQAIGDNKRPLYYLITSSVINLILDIIFVTVINLGVAGAAIATIISQFVSAILCLIRLTRINENYKIHLRKIKLDNKILIQIIKVGLPSGFQNSIIAFANVIVQSYVNSFGDMAMAGYGAYSKIEGFAFIPITSFNLAITTFISQNLGAKEYDRAKKGARFGILSTVIMAELIGIITFIFAPYLISAFDKTPEVVQFGTDKARTAALFFFLLAYSHAIASVLRGSGRATMPMMIMIICWCVIRIIILASALPFVKDIRIVYWVYPITWLLSAIAFFIAYKRVNWLNIEKEKDEKNKELK